MKPNILMRGVALALVPCLLMEPALAAAVDFPRTMIHPPLQQSAFTSQALAGRCVPFSAALGSTPKKVVYGLMAADLVIQGSGGGVTSRRRHEKEINRPFQEALYRLEKELKTMGYDVPRTEDGLINFHAVIRRAGGRITMPSGAMLRLRTETLVIPRCPAAPKGMELRLQFLQIVWPEFPGNHAGRDALAVYATDPAMAVHELIELGESITYAITKGFATIEDVQNHQLGERYLDYLAVEDHAERFRRLAELKERSEQWHLIAIQEELFARESAFRSFKKSEEWIMQNIVKAVARQRRLVPAQTARQEESRLAGFLENLSQWLYALPPSKLPLKKAEQFARMRAALLIRPKDMESSFQEDATLDARSQPDLVISGSGLPAAARPQKSNAMVEILKRDPRLEVNNRSLAELAVPARLAVFDFDNTMVNSNERSEEIDRESLRNAVQRVAKWERTSPLTEARLKPFFNRGFVPWPEVLKAMGLGALIENEDKIRNFQRIYDEKKRELDGATPPMILAGWHPLAGQLKYQLARIVVVTGNTNVEHLLELDASHHLVDQIDITPKGSPQITRFIRRELDAEQIRGLPPEKQLLFSDSVHDLREGRELGLTTIAVVGPLLLTGSIGLEARLKDLLAEADYVIVDYDGPLFHVWKAPAEMIDAARLLVEILQTVRDSGEPRWFHESFTANQIIDKRAGARAEKLASRVLDERSAADELPELLRKAEGAYLSLAAAKIVQQAAVLGMTGSFHYGEYRMAPSRKISILEFVAACFPDAEVLIEKIIEDSPRKLYAFIRLLRAASEQAIATPALRAAA